MLGDDQESEEVMEFAGEATTSLSWEPDWQRVVEVGVDQPSDIDTCRAMMKEYHRQLMIELVELLVK